LAEGYIEIMKVLMTDLDGVLSDGSYYVSSNGVVTKVFYNRDWDAMTKLMKNGIKVVILTQCYDEAIDAQLARIKTNSKTWANWMETGVFTLIKKCEDKYIAAIEYLKAHGMEWKDVVYIGDAENDRACMIKAGYTFCPADALEIIKGEANIVCDTNGGRGCIQELVEELEYQNVIKHNKE